MQRKFTIKRNTLKKVIKTGKSTSAEDTSKSIAGKTFVEEFRINIITSSTVDTSNSSRLLSPIDAEGISGKSKKRRHATKNLTLKSAPPIPTAPKDPFERKRRWLLNEIKSHIKLVDIPLTVITVLLSLCGLCAVFSSTKSFETPKFVFIQAIAIMLGLGAALIMSVIDYRSIASKYRYIIGINAFLLLLTFILGSGVTGETNANWIDLGFIKIQPSEFAKLLFIYSFAVHLAQVHDKMHKFWTVFSLAIHAGIIFSLVLLQKDLGSLTIFFIIFISMCFVAGISVWYYIAGGAAVLCVSPFIWSHLNEYQKNRIMLCFDESIDPLGLNFRYQQLQSQRAIGNGGLFGTGLGEGTITQTDLLPAKHTDMIYSTICEEFGMIGALFVLAITVYLIYRVLKIALGCGNTTGRYICVGVSSMLMIQVVENVGMCLGTMPVIGITYPFLSYGGSSVLSCFLAIGMVLSVSTHYENKFFK